MLRQPRPRPAFAAKTLPVITKTTEDSEEWQLSPVILRLLDEFGEREDVQEAVFANIWTVIWGGSMTEYFALYENRSQTSGNTPSDQYEVSPRN